MGFYSSLGAVNRTTDPGRRSYAATGYLRPNQHRKNLKVLVEALVTKITLTGNKATGVEFLDSDGKKHTVKASKEIILSGGVINSPQILELSGIGDPEVLKAAGVDCLVENEVKQSRSLFLATNSSPDVGESEIHGAEIRNKAKNPLKFHLFLRRVF